MKRIEARIFSRKKRKLAPILWAAAVICIIALILFSQKSEISQLAGQMANKSVNTPPSSTLPKAIQADHMQTFIYPQYSLSIPDDWLNHGPSGMSYPLIFEKEGKTVGGLNCLNYDPSRDVSQFFPKDYISATTEPLMLIKIEAVKASLKIPTTTSSNGEIEEQTHIYFLIRDDKIAYDLSFNSQYVDEQTVLQITGSFKLEKQNQNWQFSQQFLDNILYFDMNFGWATLNGQLVPTTDRGQTWLPAYGVTQVDLEDASKQADNVRVALAKNEEGKLTIYLAHDFSLPVQTIEVPLQDEWESAIMTQYDVSFPDAMHGWLMVRQSPILSSIKPVILYYTKNGGSSWYRWPLDIPPIGGATGMLFQKNIVGWITKMGASDSIPEIYRSTDTGKYWKRLDIPVPSKYKEQNYQTTTSLPVFDSKDDLHGLFYTLFIGQGNAELVYYETKDGGENWTPYENTLAEVPHMLGFNDKLMGYGIGSEDNTFYFLSKPGASWEKIHTNINLALASQVEAVNENEGWALIKGVLYMTSDHFKTWKRWSSQCELDECKWEQTAN